MKEHAIGERFEEGGKLLECIESEKGCLACGFQKEDRKDACPEKCTPRERSDGRLVLFVEVQS